LTVQLTVNTGKGFFNGCTKISSGDTNVVVPEPGSLSLLGTGLIAMGGNGPAQAEGVDSTPMQKPRRKSGLFVGYRERVRSALQLTAQFRQRFSGVGVIRFKLQSFLQLLPRE